MAAMTTSSAALPCRHRHRFAEAPSRTYPEALTLLSKSAIGTVIFAFAAAIALGAGRARAPCATLVLAAFGSLANARERAEVIAARNDYLRWVRALVGAHEDAAVVRLDHIVAAYRSSSWCDSERRSTTAMPHRDHTFESMRRTASFAATDPPAFGGVTNRRHPVVARVPAWDEILVELCGHAGNFGKW